MRPGRAIRAAVKAIALLLALCAAHTTDPIRAEGDRHGARLMWPLEGFRRVVSAFGEYRYDRMHAGIDISTGGATGLPVLAAASGEVFRLKVQWRGYGRAVYLRHPGGLITVYGHLERFEDSVLDLEKRVAELQSVRGTRYPGDIFLERPVPVRRGQVIGFSGEAGAGLPHLHFEVRRGDDRPVEPFAAGLERPRDRDPPVLESLTITAAAAGTFIDGTLRERVYSLESRGEIYEAEEPVLVTGPFLASLTAHDPAGGSRAGLGSIEAHVDGVLHYQLTFSTFRYAQNPVSGLIYDHRSSHLDPASYTHRLFRLPGNVLAAGNDREGDGAPRGSYPGAFDLPPGLHTLEVRASDASRNEVTARVDVRVAHPGIPRTSAPAWGTEGDRKVLLSFTLDPPSKPFPMTPGSDRGLSPAPTGREAQGEIWAGQDDGFHRMACSAERGTCVWPGDGEVPRSGVMRLRELRDGVPGPWRIVAPPAPRPQVLLSYPPRIDAWPGFLDYLVRAEVPFAPSTVHHAGEALSVTERLHYRDGLLYGAAIDYREVGARFPWGSADVNSPSAALPDNLPLATLFVAPDEEAFYQGPEFRITLPKGSRFFPGPMVIRTADADTPTNLPAAADAVELLPAGETLNVPATITFTLEEASTDAEELGIYRWNTVSSRWTYVGGELDEAGSMVKTFRRYGRFALLRDESPPTVTEVRPPHGARSVTLRPEIWARVDEEGKGLDFDGVTFVLDGKALESEFDPDRDVAKVLAVPRLTTGVHELMVFATDRAGNRSAPFRVTFEVR